MSLERPLTRNYPGGAPTFELESIATIPLFTLFSWPPVFTSRLIPNWMKQAFRTPRDEDLFLRKNEAEVPSSMQTAPLTGWITSLC